MRLLPPFYALLAVLLLTSGGARAAAREQKDGQERVEWRKQSHLNSLSRLEKLIPPTNAVRRRPLPALLTEAAAPLQAFHAHFMAFIRRRRRKISGALARAE